MMDAHRSAMVLLGHDLRAENYIADYADQAMPAQPVAGEDGSTQDICLKLATAIIGGGSKGVVALVEQALRNGMDAMTICNQGLLPGLVEVGRRYLCP